jgi:hypothetical protein
MSNASTIHLHLPTNACFALVPLFPSPSHSAAQRRWHRGGYFGVSNGSLKGRIQGELSGFHLAVNSLLGHIEAEAGLRLSGSVAGL